MTFMEQEEFIVLSEIALAEADQDRLVSVLKKRNTFLSKLFREDHDVLSREAEECIRRENMVLEKLEEEKQKIMEKINKVSKSRQAAKSYSSRYPLPFSPRFFSENQ